MISERRLHQLLKRDQVIAPKSQDSGAVTGNAYYSMKGVGRAKFDFDAAAMADGDTVIAQVMKATDANGTGATALTGATATITGSARAKRALLTGNTIADGDTVVDVTATLPDGTEVTFTFTCEDTDPDIDAGEYASGSTDTDACANLAAAINHLMGAYIKATGSSGTCILEAVEQDDGGRPVITLANAHSTIVPSTLAAEGFVEVDAADLGDGYTHLTLRLTNDATILVSADLLRDGSYNPVHNVAASKVL